MDGERKAVEGATAGERAAMRFFKVVVVVQYGRGSPRTARPTMQFFKVAVELP